MTSMSTHFSIGDVREDGYLFQGYDKRTRKDGTRKEKWLKPESYVRMRISTCLNEYRKRSAGKPFDLTTDYLIDIFPKDNKCPALGINLEWGQKNGRRNSPSLDKIDPELGYVQGNVVWVSWLANTVKSDLSIPQLRSLLHFYESIPDGRKK